MTDPSGSEPGVISATVEETNRMRAAVGLKPLRQSSSNAADSSKIFVSPTIEETNRLRLAAGLKPLRVESSKSDENARNGEKEVVKKVSEDDIIQRVREARTKRLARSAMAPKSIAEQAMEDEDGADEDDSEIAANEWIQRLGKRSTEAAKDAPLAKRRRVVSSKKAALEQNVDVAHDVNSLQKGHTEVLTLRDAPVSDDFHTMDVLEKSSLTPKEKEDVINGLTYDGTDNAEFRNLGDMPGAQSVAVTAPVIESELQPKQKIKQRKRPRKGRKTSFKPVVGRMEQLRAREKALAREDNKDDEDDEDDHWAALQRATKKAKERQTQTAVDRILKAIENAEGGDDGDVEIGAKVVATEMAQFLGDEDMEDDDDSERERKVRFFDPDVQMNGVQDSARKPDVSDKDKEASAETKPEETVPVDFALPAKIPIEKGIDTNGMTGIAATLVRLRSRGELKHKTALKGRRGDKRITRRSDTADERPEIKLSYLDEYGNELTAKEAFRMLSHKFHGKGPGRNKREKKLREMLQATKNRSRSIGDTPLSSLAALRDETKKLGTAHVVLSGNVSNEVTKES